MDPTRLWHAVDVPYVSILRDTTTSPPSLVSYIGRSEVPDMRSRTDFVDNDRERSLVVEVPRGTSGTSSADPEVPELAERRRFTLPLLVSMLLILSLYLPGYGQYFTERNDETYLILALKKQKARFDAARVEYTAALELKQRNMIALNEFERIKTNYINEEISYQQAMLRVIFDQPHILIEKAVKYQAEDGKKRVRLTLRNTTGGVADYEMLMQTDDSVFDPSLQPDKINNVFISLHESPETGVVGPIISQPYEDKIETLGFGDSARVDFLLLKDVEEVIVSMTYAGATDRKHIYLQKDASANRVIVSSPNFSQESNLGESATYPLELERFSNENDVFRLAVVNLPRQITYNFLDPTSVPIQRLSQVNFTQGVTSKQLALTAYLPERSDVQVGIDKTITFYALVLPQEVWEDVQPLDKRSFSEKEIDGLDAGRVKLELIPRGVGRIEVRALNLYHEIRTDEDVSMEVTVHNDGSRRLDNIRIRTNMPPSWQSDIHPDVISELKPAEEFTVKLRFLPPGNVEVGDYEIQIQTQALAYNRPVETQDKTVRIHINAVTNLWLSASIVFCVIGVLVGIVWYSVKLTRR